MVELKKSGNSGRLKGSNMNVSCKGDIELINMQKVKEAYL